MSALVPTHGNGAMITAPPAGAFGLEGFEDLGQNDIILPRWSIVQPVSKREGADTHVGQWVRNIDGEFRPLLEVVLLKVSPNRILWSGDLADTQPECVSRDGVAGSAYGACASCSFNVQANPALREDPRAKRCNFGYAMVVCDDVEQGTMALVGAMGTSVRPLKTLTTQFIQRKRPAFGALVTLGTERTTNDKGVFYVIKPAITQWFTDQEAAYWRELYQSVAGQTVRDYDEADAGTEEAVPF